jgi:hypothetical protein
VVGARAGAAPRHKIHGRQDRRHAPAEPDEYEQARVEAKLVRQWQLALVSRSENLWSNDLLWLVLVPGGHYPATGSCCGPPPTFSWNMAMTKDDSGGAGLDGVIAGTQGDAPPWYRLLPDLSGGGQ